MDFKLLTVVLDEADRIIAVNRNFLKSTGYEIEDIRGKKFSELLSNGLDKKISTLRELSGKINLTIRKKDSTYLYFDGKIYHPLIRKKRLTIIRGYDITELKHLEKLCKILFSINSTIIHSKSKSEIYENICKILVDNFGLQMAWIGEVRNGEVKPIYWYGVEEGYLSRIKIVLDPEKPEGWGPTAEAIRGNLISINEDSRTNPKYEAFREEALKRNYLSSVAIPLTIKGEQKVVLNLYSREPNFFNERVRPLLEEIKKNLEFALEQIEKEKFIKIISTAMLNSDLLIVVTDREGIMNYLNPQVELFLGVSEENLLGKHITLLSEDFEEVKGFADIQQILNSGEGFSGIIELRKKHGESLYIDLKVIPINTPDDISFVWIGRDLTMEVSLMEMIDKLRNYDQLTNTLTLRSVITRAEQVLPYIKNVALVITIDLYQFTYINETLGISVGDQLLRECADRLRKAIGDRNLLARVASDEFLIFAFDFPTNASIVFFLESLKSVFREPFRINHKDITLKYNIGVALYPQDGNDPEALYKKASTACAFAKKEGPNVIKFFEPKLETLMHETLKSETLIEEALEKGYFHFYFQPYFFTNTLSIAGAEALIRIKKPNGELIPPSLFIETLESSPHRTDFELWAIKTIVDKINTYKIPIGLNLYPKTFQNEHFWIVAEKHLSQLTCPLVLEITERGFIENPDRTIKLITKLKTKFPQIKLAIDDFGTGYSNLGYLKNLPVDLIKIDIMFVKDLTEGLKERGLVKTIVDLAHILGAKALAEGVETKEHFEILDIMGCDYVQGFFFDKPLSEEDFVRKYLPNLCSQLHQCETQS